MKKNTSYCLNGGITRKILFQGVSCSEFKKKYLKLFQLEFARRSASALQLIFWIFVIGVSGTKSREKNDDEEWARYRHKVRLNNTHHSRKNVCSQKIPFGLTHVHGAYYKLYAQVREAAKKVLFLWPRLLRGGG